MSQKEYEAFMADSQEDKAVFYNHYTHVRTQFEESHFVRLYVLCALDFDSLHLGFTTLLCLVCLVCLV